MLYHCKNETIDLKNQNLSILNKCRTNEGICYQKDNNVYKIYYDKQTLEYENIEVIDKRACYELTKISNRVNYFYLPTELIYDEDKNYVGYKTKFIPPLPVGKLKLVEKSIDCFFGNVEGIERDISKLIDYKCLLFDVNTENIIDNGKINIFDVGAYEIDFANQLSEKEIASHNLAQLNFLLEEILLDEIIKKTKDWHKAIQAEQYLKQLAQTKSFLSVLEEETKGYDSISQFANEIVTTKKKVRKLKK